MFPIEGEIEHIRHLVQILLQRTHFLLLPQQLHAHPGVLLLQVLPRPCDIQNLPLHVLFLALEPLLLLYQLIELDFQLFQLIVQK